MKKALKVRIGEDSVRLRLTLGGQKRLKSRRGEDTLQTVLAAAGDGEAMADLLEEALNWEGSGNTVTSGEELYDLLVDSGYAGQEDFGSLAFDLAACSGLMEEGQASALKKTLHEAVASAYAQLDGAKAPGSPQPEVDTARPTAAG